MKFGIFLLLEWHAITQEKMVADWMLIFCIIFSNIYTNKAILKDVERFREEPTPVERISLHPLNNVSEEVEYQSVALVEDNGVIRNATKKLLEASQNKDFSKSSVAKDATNDLLNVSTLQKTNKLPTEQNQANELIPFVVYPQPSTTTTKCRLDTNRTSFTVHRNSAFKFVDGSEDTNQLPTNAFRCSITIKKAVPSICQLSLQFHDFDFYHNEKQIEPNSDNFRGKLVAEERETSFCRDGGVKIQTRENTKEEHVICGNLTGQFKELPFDETMKILEIHSTQSSPTSFNFTVRQIDCQENSSLATKTRDISDLLLDAHLGVRSNVVERDSGIQKCNQIIEAEEFVLQSPKYPSNYPNSIDCTTIVYPFNDNICALGNSFSIIQSIFKSV